MMERRGWPVVPIWPVALFAIAFYVVQHYYPLITLQTVPCEVKDWSLVELAVMPLAVVAIITAIAIGLAVSRRPLLVVASRAFAHVGRVLLALVLAVFSLSLIAIAARGAATNDELPATSAPQETPHETARAAAHTPLPPGPARDALERAAKRPAPTKVCSPALPSYLDRHPWHSGLWFALILAVGVASSWRWYGTLKTATGSRRNARWLQNLPARELGFVAFVLVLVWPGKLLISAALHGGIHLGGNPVRVAVLVLSAVYLVRWAIDRAFRGLQLAARAATEFARFDSTPHPDYTARVASEDRADILVFSDMHLAPMIDGHPMRTMDQTTESFDDGTIRLVEDLLTRVKPAAIIVAGDVTDTGHPSSWDRATKLLKMSDIPTYVAPGNHDVHFRWLTPELIEKQGGVELVLGEVFATDDPHVPSRDSFDEAEIARRIDAIAPAGKRAKGSRFPILYQNDALRLSVLILDSNRRPPTSPISNAIGLVGQDQLEAAAKLLKTRPAGFGLVIVLHHHVVPPDTLELHIGLRCEDAEDVLDFAAGHGADAIIHGHKHMPYVYRALVKNHPLFVVSCGSTLYDAVGPQKDTVKRASAAGLHVQDGHVIDVVFFPARN
jgi:3',5'-cyclic AMP phosphodiesterase CpdA